MRATCLYLRGLCLRPVTAGPTMLILLAEVASGQGVRSGPLPAVAFTPTFLEWSFREPVSQDSLAVKRVSQLAFPLSGTVGLGRFSLDLHAAYAIGQAGLADGRTLDITGLTDVQLRSVTRFLDDRLIVLLGANLPTGPTNLWGEALDAYRILASPGLAMPVPALGAGLGGIAGLVYAWQAGGWGLAVGSSFEVRGNYAPVEAQLAGLSVPADLNPGNLARVTLGADRLLGDNRISVLLSGELSGDALASVAAEGASPTVSRYRLGPVIAGQIELELAARGYRRMAFVVVDSYRSRYEATAGDRVVGSSGNLLVLAFDMVKGRPQGLGLSVQASGRFDTGLEIDNTITTAAASTGGIRVGLPFRSRAFLLEPFVEVRAGRIDTGPESTRMVGYAGGVSVQVVR